ncbi:hypothetical protein LX15_000398 [Streptoalloteichus tenebrarius]|uniref:Uncharacterized protein n=1 Tax=Streptoalloteichus tenebrarius (strain ATCC 17920 / DSM 40477 / JCM 4838 / CBS 697.72 / NBRC 16177 / NCIMB 11028 / NRRL B-12390 / A12253. 1 / ISP 5477) TaxID=1933 RepID=A0ABT1HMI9_STRSD|nr:hypothetical protein [Streptoalloteichus tenebrarius]MCP2256715.1 hypothetical protein [Streptoalloteichus tenebrarius]
MNANRPPGGEHDDARGRLAEELHALVDAVADRAQPWLERLRAGGGAAHDTGSCGWCPVCQGLAVLRGERPEVASRITEQVAGLLATLRSVVEQAPTGGRRQEPEERTAPEPATPSASTSTATSASADGDQSDVEPRVRRITVRRAAPTRDGGPEC